MNDSPYFKAHDPANFESIVPNTGCMVSNRVSVEGHPIRFMVRQEPVDPADSGWAFYSGINEDDDYTNDPKNFQIFSLNTVANIDQSILPFLDATIGTAYEKGPGHDQWIKV